MKVTVFGETPGIHKILFKKVIRRINNVKITNNKNITMYYEF